MERFAPRVFERHTDRMVQVDFDVTSDPDMVRRFHVPGTPTFVLLDVTGKEVTRFFYEASADRLQDRLVKYVGEGTSSAPLPTRDRGAPR